MRVGYVANPGALACKANHTFRLASFSEARLFETIAANLDCLGTILRFNVDHGLGFYRISSGTIPFASHPICQADWSGRFSAPLNALGEYIRKHAIRISMHPGQYTVLNAPYPETRAQSIAELHYHATLLDRLGLDRSARIQIHVGGVYGDKARAMDDFCKAYEGLAAPIRSRLAIENDDGRFSLADCLAIHARVGVPVIFDNLHHQCLNEGEPMGEALRLAAQTWRKADGPPMIDYSSQQPGRRPGTHAERLDEAQFRRFLDEIKGIDCDIMLELRDKEASALKALRLAGSR